MYTMKLPRSLVAILLLLTFFAASVSAEEPFYLHGRVKDAVRNTDLSSAVVVLYDADGNPKDSIKADRGMRIVNGEVVELAFYGFAVERKDSTYVFDVTCPGYATKTVTYRLEKVGRKEEGRTIPIVFLEKAPHKLDEVTVTASKIKFYHKGDTLVYNASAFQLAEGSMLDALISSFRELSLMRTGR